MPAPNPAIADTPRGRVEFVGLTRQTAAQALKRADRAYLLETGRIVRGASAADLLADDAVRAAYLGGDVEA